MQDSGSDQHITLVVVMSSLVPCSTPDCSTPDVCTICFWQTASGVGQGADIRVLVLSILGKGRVQHMTMPGW